MLNRIDEKFNELKLKNRKALITYLAAGDPDIEATSVLVKEMVSRGADIVEIGIPYSDPVAEGPVIQRAHSRALSKKIKISDIMGIVKTVRKSVNVPIIYLVYFNCILQYGVDKFFNDLNITGVDGIIIPDLPFEERWEVDEFAARHNVHVITLVSPTSENRLSKMLKNPKGFIYCITSLGVTGMRNEFNTDFEHFIKTVKKYTSLPTALGFGISAPEHIRRLKDFSDGLIVGSAVVKKIEDSKNLNEALEKVGAFVSDLKGALDT